MNFVVDRSKWARQVVSKTHLNPYGESALMNDLGNMCCLGFVCKQLGADDSSLRGRAYPRNLTGESGEKVSGAKVNGLLEKANGDYVRYIDGPLTTIAATINDDFRLSDEDKERLLKDVFIAFGHNIEFIGDSSKEQDLAAAKKAAKRIRDARYRARKKAGLV